MILFDVALVFLSGILTLSVYYIDKLRDPNLLELGYFLNSNLPYIIRNEKSYVIFTNLLYDKLIYIPISIGISIIILGIVRSVLQHSITKRHRLYNVLNTIIGSDFFGNISDSRITVFKCYSYLRSLSLYLIYWFWDSRYRNKFEIFKKRFPKFNRRYLFFYKRKGVPNENHSSLKIMVPNNESEINGFIAHCLYINAYDSINLPSLKNININNYDDLDSIPRNKKK